MLDNQRPNRTVTSSLTNVDNSVKCRAQLLPHHTKPPSSFQIMRDIYRTTGLRGLYFGGLITSLRDSIGYGFYFWGYEGSKFILFHENDSDRIRMYKMLSAGGIAGCITWASVYPLGMEYRIVVIPDRANVDTIKTRYQTQYLSGLDEIKPLLAAERRYTSTWHCVTDTFRNDGVVGMFRGVGVTMVRAFIGKIILFCLLTKLMLLRFMAMNGSKNG
jgi:solute carrier family 25 carnitine/acylcarnitine transporter 20/29